MQYFGPHGFHESALKAGPEPGFRLADVPVPEVGPTDVLIRVEKAGVCGTDQHIYAWDKWAQARIRPPLVVGHEFMGTVEAVGGAVSSVRVGERVSAEGHIADLTCVLCRTGEAHICERVRDHRGRSRRRVRAIRRYARIQRLEARPGDSG